MDMVFTLTALIGGTVLVFQFVLMLLGMGGDHDLSGADGGHLAGGMDAGHIDPARMSAAWMEVTCTSTVSAALISASPTLQVIIQRGTKRPTPIWASRRSLVL